MSVWTDYTNFLISKVKAGLMLALDSFAQPTFDFKTHNEPFDPFTECHVRAVDELMSMGQGAPIDVECVAELGRFVVRCIFEVKGVRQVVGVTYGVMGDVVSFESKKVLSLETGGCVFDLSHLTSVGACGVEECVRRLRGVVGADVLRVLSGALNTAQSKR